jgi:hypothetical protein
VQPSSAAFSNTRRAEGTSKIFDQPAPLIFAYGVNVWRCGVAVIGLSHLRDTPEFRRVINSLEKEASYLVDRQSRT